MSVTRVNSRFSRAALSVASARPEAARRSASSERYEQGPDGLVLFRPGILPACRSSYSEAIVILREGYGKNSANGARVETVDNGFSDCSESELA